MTFKEMFLAEHPIDGEQMLEEARIKAAKGSGQTNQFVGRQKAMKCLIIGHHADKLSNHVWGQLGVLCLLRSLEKVG